MAQSVYENNLVSLRISIYQEQIMTNLLRDPIWNGIAAIIAIVALVVAIRKENLDWISLTQRLVIVGSRALLGVIVLLPGIPVQYSISKIIEGGVPLLINAWQGAYDDMGLSGIVGVSLSFSFFPGFVSALIASTGNTLRQSIQRSVFTVMVTLTFADILNIMLGNNDIGGLPASIAYNIMGGIIAGPIIAYAVRLVDTAFSQSLSHQVAT
jgi:hypothetical protein